MASPVADLHVHTSYSDGTMSPACLMEKAQWVGLEVLAITDHDTVTGVPEAREAGERLGVAVIAGVELSAWELGRELHLAGLFIDSGSRKLAPSLEALRTRRRARIHEIVQKLAALGVIIEVADVFDLASSDSVGRPHVAEAMVRRGVVESQGEAFARYLADGAPAYVPRQTLTFQENAQLVREAGGILIWAHPGEPPEEEGLKKLLDAGLQGIEAYTPMHTPEVTAAWLKLAQEFGLMVSGGSDFHGNRTGGEALGAVGLSRDEFEKLSRRIAVSGR